ncbi:MAG: OsmC family protein [Bacteroidia bacterium]|nr:OsmC family protein [Bacteroidia bacterium]
MPTTHTVTAHWQSGMQFDVPMGTHTVTIDALAEFGGTNAGPNPKPLMLTSLAGCTGMDVASLLTKQRIPLSLLEIEVSAELTDEHPKVYRTVHLVYRASGEGLTHEQLDKAVRLSQEKYCGVSAMFRQFATLTYELHLV